MDNKLNEILIKLNNMKELQKDSLESNYMFGLYNGIELAIATIEGRKPVYKNPYNNQDNKQDNIDNLDIREISSPNFHKSIDYSGFKNDLSEMINKFSIENSCDTPDFVLSEFLFNCLKAYIKAINTRDKWFQFKPWENKKQKSFLTATIALKDLEQFDGILKILDDLNGNVDIPKYVKDKLYKDLNQLFEQKEEEDLDNVSNNNE